MNTRSVDCQPFCKTTDSDLDFVYVAGLCVGDRLIRRKAFGTKHHGIFAGIQDGQALIAENQLGFGVRYVTLSEFLLHDYSNLHRIEPISESAHTDVTGIIEHFLGKPYNLVTFNCEHFAHLVQYGQARSSQARNAWIIFGFLLSSLLSIIS